MTVTVRNNAKQLKSELQKRLDKALHQIGQSVVGDARENITDNDTVDTGLLRAQTTFEVYLSDLKVRIGNPLKYAIYIEYGTGLYAENGKGRKTPWVYEDRKGVAHFTRGSHPAPFLRPALEEGKKTVKDIVEKNLKGFGGA